MSTVSQHFVTFMSPGTFVPETTEKPIRAWDTAEAVTMARAIKERHGATPFGFYFTTRTRGPDDLDSKQTARSGYYYLGGTVITADEVLAGTDPKEETLRANVRINGVKRILVNENSWRFTTGLNDDDTVLEFAP